MMNKLDIFKGFLRGKRIAVLGIGISNRPLIRYISDLGGHITAFDKLPAGDPVLRETREAFISEGIDINWRTGPDYLQDLKGFDLIFRTPQMRWDLPQLRAERERGAIITSEMEVFMELCPARIFGVTGSDGKTTTTTLISLMLRQAGYRVHLGGNIGIPLLDRIDHIRPEDMVVLELSSFQLMSMRISPEVAVVTNVSPNHLDVHKDYQEYIDAKRNILAYQPFYGRLILNADNYETKSYNSDARGEVIWFSQRDQSIQTGCLAIDGQLVWRQHDQEIPFLASDDIKLPGRHNVDNYLAAAAAVWPYVKPADIGTVAMTFGGVEHRLELVRELSGVRYYNSSIDTSPTRTKAALRAMADRNERVVLITGGQDKKCDYTGLGEAIVTVSDRIILCGSNADRIEKVLRREAAFKGIRFEDLTIYRCQDYEDAVNRAKALAKPGDVVVSSPAGTSYDRFRHFEERGNLFKDLVNRLSPEDESDSEQANERQI